jgi:integrase
MTGIQVRHTRSCRTQDGGSCNCKPSYRAWVWDARSNSRIFKTFKNQAEAKSWRGDSATALRKGTMSAPSKTTVREAGEALIEGMRSGAVRTRKGTIYKPSATRSYEAALRDRIYPELGALRVTEVQPRDVQRLADEMLAARKDASTIRNALMPLRVIYRRALEDGDVAVNPTTNLRLPAVEGKRDRIVSPEEAKKLLAALAEKDRPLWATALYAGLRRGEIMGLRIEDVNLAKGVIRVERSYDPKAYEFTEPKSRAGKRSVPIASVLRDYLIEHKLRMGKSEGLFFGRTVETPFDDSSLAARAATAWRNAELEGITLHEARHTYASLMIAAGVNAKSLQTYMGHSSVTVTYDRYGHLMPGNEDEAAALLDAYLDRADTQARAAQLRHSEAQ